MKSFIAIPALFAATALAGSEWAFTWTFSDAHSTWTSCSYAHTGLSNATTTGPATTSSASHTGTASEWTSATSYTATYSSGSSTWGIPTTVSYSVGQGWTSMIPAPTSSAAGEKTSENVKATTPATTTATAAGGNAAAKTSASPSHYTGAAAPIRGSANMAGVGAVALAGLALVL
ncbi:hypothetical protein ABEF95_014118 [Exophiala dermatitidis]